MAIKITGTNTAAAPGITGDDTDTGLFYGTNEIGFSTGGTSRLTLDSSGYLNVPDNGKIRLGTGNDLEIYHDGSGNSIIQEDNNLYIKANSTWIQAAQNDVSGKFAYNGAVELYYDNSKKFETVSHGVTITGNAFWADNGQCQFGNTFGSADLNIYHDGTDSYISNGTGELKILGDDIKLRSIGGEKYLTGAVNGAVEIYHNNVRKLNTEVAGIRVDGASGGDGILSLYSNAGNSNSNLWRIESAASGSNFYIKNGASGSWETNIRCEGNSQVQLYYDNSLKLETTSLGVQIPDNVNFCLGNGADIRMWFQDSSNPIAGYIDCNQGHFYIRNNVNDVDGGDIYIQGRSGEDSIIAKNDGAVELYYDNVKHFQTVPGGIQVLGAEGGSAEIYLSADEADDNADKWRMEVSTNSNFYHQNFAAGSWETNWHCEGNGAMSLYYDSAAKLETTSTGALVTGKFCIGAADRNIDWHHPLQVEGISAETSSISICRNSNDVNPPYLTFCKTRGTAVGGTTVVNDNDLIANIQFKAADGDAGESTAAQITAEIDGTPGSSDTPGRIVFKTSSDGSGSPTTRMTIDSSGNINMPSDSKYFRIGADNDIQLYHISGVNYWKNQGSTVFKMVDTGGDTQIECNNNDATKLFYNGSEKFYTTSGGTCTLGNMYAEAGGICQTLVHTGTGEIARFRANTSSTVGNITVSASSTTYNTSSDYRLKENTVPLSDGITRLKTLKPYRFNFKVEPSKTVDGFFAHEVTPAVPEAITGEKDASEMQQIDQSKLVPLLTAALQEEIKLRENLEARVATLEAS